MNSLIKENFSKITEACQNHHVESLYIFGSVNSISFSNESDVDFLVKFKNLDFGEYTENYFSFVDKLEEILGRSVDLVTDKSLSNPYFIQELNKSKMHIYGNPIEKALT